MRPRDLTALIGDIQGCIQEIEQFTSGFTFNDFEQSALVQRAVERDFIIIGEAVKRMRHVSEEVSSRIDRAVSISGFRNFLVYEYEVIDEKQVWRTVTDSVPLLKQQINAWADELGMEPLPEQTR
jgi:uncharacterized protein with HEPN domain